MGLSALPNAYERFLGMQGMHGKYASSMANRNADLIIGIGVRFSDRATGKIGTYAERAKIIQLDTDISEINKNVKVDIGLVGDMISSFGRILDRCEAKKHPKWQSEIKKYRQEEQRLATEAENRAVSEMTPSKLFEIINAYKDRNTVIATDVGQHQMWTAQFTSFSRTRRFASSGGLGTMGYGLGAAIGAHVASGDKVVLITGDGSFGMNLNELATAVTYNIPVVIVLINNGVLGMVRQWQTLFFDKRYSHTELNRNTDYVMLAKAFGVKASRATTLAEFEQQFKTAFDYDGPYLIDTVMDRNELVLPMLPPNSSVDALITEKE